MDCLSTQVVLTSAQWANSASTIKFIKELQAQNPGAKLALIWDGASYHRSQELRNFLAEVNQGEDWQVHCLRLAPYAPEENPIENIWGQLKHLLRQMHQRCCSFKVTKKLFEMLIRYQLFVLPDLSTYGAFSILNSHLGLLYCSRRDARSVWAGLVTSGCNRKDSRETRPYTIYTHVAPDTVKSQVTEG